MLVKRLGFLLAALLLLVSCGKKTAGPGDEFARLTNVGKNYYEKGEAAKAIEPLTKALALNPTHPEAHLNLANALLRADQPDQAAQHAQEALKLNHNSGAAHYVLGCAQLRLGKPKEAVQALQQAKDIDRTVNAVSFQLGRAYQQLGQFQEALEQFQEVTQFETNHPAAYYNLSQTWMRLGNTDEAQQALAEHQRVHAGKPGQITDPSLFEKCQYTQIVAPFKLEQPNPKGIPISFVEATAQVFGTNASRYRGPIGVVDLKHDGHPSLFLVESNGFRMVFNSNGTFYPAPAAQPAIPGANYYRTLAGDLNNDRAEDLIVLGDKGSHVFKLTTNGVATDIGTFSKLAGLAAVGGALVDLDFTAKLDLIAITAGSNSVKVLRNLGQPYFSDNTTNSGVPPGLTGAQQVLIEDWTNDDLLDVFIAVPGRPPVLLVKERGGPLVTTNLTSDWPAAAGLAAGDVNNDLRFDVALLSGNAIVVMLNGLKERHTIPLSGAVVRQIRLLDYDNDGWLDLVGLGDGVHIFRNVGAQGFKNVTKELGLGAPESVAFLGAADFDVDGDTDFVLAMASGGLKFLRNNGGNANGQIKLHLLGTKSNASGIGIRVEIAAEGLRLVRRVGELPVAIGVGSRTNIDSLTAHWFDVNLNYTDVAVNAKSPLALDELVLPTGSCPYLYAWDGKEFRFVTDLLGAAPAGLPISETRLIEADPDEYVWLGDEKRFPPRGSEHVLQITEELREVLYLDAARLVVVDHPAGTEVHTTGKLLPGKPFPPHQIITLHHPRPLLKAEDHRRADVTAALRTVDGEMVSPQLRIPQLRGLAERHAVTLDFGALPAERPLVLAITGWLRFGGGMANVAASHHPDLPFPFPVLEAETSDGWTNVDVRVGAPAGKTKRFVVDLTGKLPPGSRRLRLSAALEIHWDQIALWEKRDNSETRITAVAPTKTDLHWRGFCDFKDLPWHQPLTPDYARVRSQANWTITPGGWCTRYGPVDELSAERDNALALINGGDELTLAFGVDKLPPRAATAQRDFFLFTSGWDKDADFHCVRGWEVEPIPWHGMDDQNYGREARPEFPSDHLMRKYNTRWVGPRTLSRKNP